MCSERQLITVAASGRPVSPGLPTHPSRIRQGLENRGRLDPVIALAIGILVIAAVVVKHHLRSRAIVEEEDIREHQRRDVLRAIKSMRKDESEEGPSS